MPRRQPKLKLMVASTIYGFQTEISQLCATLQTFGYTVLNSHIGTIAGIPGKSNTESCLIAVEQCDAFLGIIRPFYSSGITHQEIAKAIELNKPYWFTVHAHVEFSRQLLKQYRYDTAGRKLTFPFQKTAVMDDLRAIEVYEEVINVGGPIEQRRWAQSFFHFNELLTYAETAFRDVEAVRKRCEEMRS